MRASTQPALAESIGIAAVLVQAKDAAAKAWYLGQAELLEVPAGGRALWLPVGWWWVINENACFLTRFNRTAYKLHLIRD